MKQRMLRMGLCALVALTILSGYAACFVAGGCTCAVVGSCYSQKVLPNCQVPTCLIADTTAVAWTVCAGNGPYTGRELAFPDSICCPSACRVYDACTQQYVSLYGDLCCFGVMRYQGTGSDCE